MSLNTKAPNGNGNVDTTFLSSNHKVIHYLQNSTLNSNNSSNVLRKATTQTSDLFPTKETSVNSNVDQQSSSRIRSCSEAGSSSSVNDTLSRSDFCLGSSLSDPGVYCSIFSSTTSSSGICSTFSDTGHEEGTSTSSEELDFNLGFDQISDSDDLEIANLNEIDDDECDQREGDQQRISTKNWTASGGIAIATIIFKFEVLLLFFRYSYAT